MTFARRGFAQALALGAALLPLALCTPSWAAGGELDHAVRGLASSDFRVRVGSVLALGRSHSPKARVPLEGALRDAHPAVRAAAASALGALGEPAAVAALDRAARHETMPGVRAEMRRAAADLRAEGAAAAPPSLAGARYVVRIGSMSNSSDVHDETIADVMRAATRKRAASLSGAVLAEAGADALVKAAARKSVPVLIVDGSLSRVRRDTSADGVTISAKVDFSVRRLPEQLLKGMVSGNASASDNPSALRSDSRVAELVRRAVGGAADSAMASVGVAVASFTR